MVVVAITVGETQAKAVMMLHALPVRVVAAGMKWAIDRIRPVAWSIVVALIGGGIYWYCPQPSERRWKIGKVARRIGTRLLRV